jgi:hypothetical protein
MTACPFSSALMALLPGALVVRRREYEWRSATFSGVRLVLDLQVEGLDAARTKTFATKSEDYEFSLPGLLVADIAVTERQATEAGIALTVEALLLEDEL